MHIIIAILGALAALEPAEPTESAKTSIIYDCVVNASAKVSHLHLEGSTFDAIASNDPEEAYVMEVTFLDSAAPCVDDCGVNVKIREIATSNPDARVREYCNPDNNQILPHSYSTVSAKQFFTELHSDEDLGILKILGDLVAGNRISYWHAGFQYPGCVDTELTVRGGYCTRRIPN